MQRAIRASQALGAFGTEPDVTSGNVVASSLSRGGQWVGAFALLQHLSAEALQLDGISLGAAVGATARGDGKPGLWQHAWETLLSAKERRARASEVAYNAAISTAEKCGRWRGMLELVTALPLNGLEVGSVCCASAILGCSKGYNSWSCALRLYDMLVVLSLEPDASSCSVLLAQCEQRGRSSCELALLECLGEGAASLNTLSSVA